MFDYAPHARLLGKSAHESPSLLASTGRLGQLLYREEGQVTYVLIIWLHINGYPVMVEPYTTLETCQKAADKGLKEHRGGFWYCIPKDEKRGG